MIPHNSNSLKLLATACLALSSFSHSARADVLASWGFESETLANTFPFTADVTDASLTVSAMTDSGLSGTAGHGDVQDTAPFDSLALGTNAIQLDHSKVDNSPSTPDGTKEYVEFSLTSSDNDSISIDDITIDLFDSLATGQSAAKALRALVFIDVNGGGFTATQGFTQNVSSGGPGPLLAGPLTKVFSTTLVRNVQGTVTIRIAFSDNSGLGLSGAAAYFDNVVVNGSVGTAVPVPAETGGLAQWSFNNQSIDDSYPDGGYTSDIAAPTGLTVSNLTENSLDGTGFDIQDTAISGESLGSPAQRLSLFRITNGNPPVTPDDDYLSFTLTPGAGRAYSLQEIAFDFGVASTDSGKVLRAELYASTDGFNSSQLIGAAYTVNNTVNTLQGMESVSFNQNDTNFPLVLDEATEFRIAFSDNSSAGGDDAGGYIDNIIVRGEEISSDTIALFTYEGVDVGTAITGTFVNEAPGSFAVVGNLTQSELNAAFSSGVATVTSTFPEIADEDTDLPSAAMRLKLANMPNSATPTSADHYLEFTVAPVNGNQLQLDTLTYDQTIAAITGQSAKAIRSSVFTSTDGINFSAALNGVTSTSSGAGPNVGGPQEISTDMSSIVVADGTTLTIRIGFSDNSSLSINSAAAFFDNLKLTGAVQSTTAVFEIADNTPNTDYDFGTALRSATDPFRTIRFENDAGSSGDVTVSATIINDAGGLFSLPSAISGVTLNPGDPLDITVNLDNSTNGTYTAQLSIDADIDLYDRIIQISATVADGILVTQNWNDTSPEGDLDSATTAGGTGWEAGSLYVGNTSLLETEAGDLTGPTSSGTNYTLAASQGGAAPLRLTNFFNTSVHRQQVRKVSNEMAGNIWFSYLAEIADGNNPTVGLTFNYSVNSVDPASQTNPQVGIEDGVLTARSNSISSDSNRGITFSAGNTYLIVGYIETGNQIRLWVDPDVSSTGTLGTADVTHFLTAGQLDSISTVGVVVRGQSGDGVALDNLLISNTDTAFNDVTGGTQNPQVLIANSTTDTNYDFGTVTSLPSAVTRTITFENTGTQSVTVNSVSILNDADDVFTFNSGVSSSLPAVVSSGGTFDIAVDFDSAVAGVFAGSVFVDTDNSFTDITLPATATFSPDGLKLIINGNLEDTGTFLGWKPTVTQVAIDGMAPGSSTAARIVGSGDPVTVVDNESLAQNFATPASDFTITFFTAIPDFTAWTGEVVDGSYGSRSFQLWVQTDDGVDQSSDVFKTGGTEGSSAADNTFLNLAYLPDGTSFGGTPGFYVHDGTGWNLLSALGTMTASVDDNGDGDFTDGGDTLNLYRVCINCRNIGTFNAEYDITVSSANSYSAQGTVTGQTKFFNNDVFNNPGAGLQFLTDDQSLTAPIDPSIDQPSFVVDDVCVISGDTKTDPDLVFADVPFYGSLISPVGDQVQTLTLRNDGSSSLNITAIASSDANFSVYEVGTTNVPSLPVNLAEGATQSYDVAFDPTGVVGLDSTRITVTSTDGINSTETLDVVASVVSANGFNVLSNGDFENGVSDWIADDGGIGTSAAGFVPGSSGSASIGAGGYLQQSLGTAITSDFTVDVVFQSNGGANNRWINIGLSAASDDDSEAIVSIGESLIANIRYNGSSAIWQAFSGIPGGGGAWMDVTGSLPTNLVANKIYILRLVGHGFGAPGANYDLKLYDVAGNVLGQSIGITAFQVFSGEDIIPQSILFSQEFGGSGFYVEDLSFSTGANAADFGGIHIEVLNFTKNGNDFNVEFTSVLGETYKVKSTTSLDTPFADETNLNTSGIPSGGTTTNAVFTDDDAGSSVFYLIEQE